MRLLLALAALAVAAPQMASANETIKVSEVNAFIYELNKSINEPFYNSSRHFLQNRISEAAVFENNMYRQGYHYGWDGRLVNQAYAPHYYRYPYAPFADYRVASVGALNKWDLISTIEHKNNSISGYYSKVVLRDIDLTSDRNMAIVDVGMAEYGATYDPYGRYYTSSNGMFTNASCKMFLTKQNGLVTLTGLRCNTNAI